MKQHGNTGKQNALKGTSAATSFLHIRITPQGKALYVRQAQREGLKLSEWVIGTLNKNLAEFEAESLDEAQSSLE